MEASTDRTSLGRISDLGQREEDVSSDTENRNDNDVFRCGKCELQFPSSYQLHHHIAYTHAGITMDTADRPANPYPVEPLALNLKHSNRVDSPINKSCDPSPLSKHYRKGSQSVALDLSKPPSNPGEALDLSTTKLPSFREGEITGHRRHQGEVTPNNDQHLNRFYDQKTFENGCDNDLGKAAADEMVKRGQFLVDNPPGGDSFTSCHESEGEENQLVIDCSSVRNNLSNEEKKYDASLKDSVGSNFVTNSQGQHPYGKSESRMPDNRGQTRGNRQSQHHSVQNQGQRSDNQSPAPSLQNQDCLPHNQGQGLLPQSQGQGLSTESEAGRFNGLQFPFSLQQQLMMMNGGASPPIPSYGMMTSDMQQSLMNFQQQMSPFMQGKPGPVKTAKVSRRSRVKAADLHEDKSKSVVEIYECKVCNRKFSQVGNFHNHMKLHSTKVCVCGICKIEFLDSYELQRHMRKTHTGDMPYKCEQCDREFSQYNNLRRHLRVHNGKSYKCHICGRTFNEVFYLEMHIGSHTGERTYSCGVCSLTFRDNAELQRHVQTHSAAELHTCEVCGKSFSKACVLRQHKKMHSGLRPFKCDICDKAFIHRHHLKIHSRMHSTDKPYRCKICGKDFAQTSHLYKHVRQHAHKSGEDDSDVCTQAEIQALYPGLCQGSRGTPSPLTTSGVSDLSQSSGSPVNSPIAEEECHSVQSGVTRSTSPGVNDPSVRSQLSDNEAENECDVKTVGKYKAVLPDMKIASVGCEDAYKFDDGIGLDHNMNEGEDNLMDRPLEDLKSQEESTASDTMESDIDTESGELSPLENEGQHDYREFDVRGNLLNQADFSYKDKISSVQPPAGSNISKCQDFSERIKEECGQASHSGDDVKVDVTLNQRLGLKMEDVGVTSEIAHEKITEEKKTDSQKSNVKQTYSIEQLLKNKCGNKFSNNKFYSQSEQAECELFERKLNKRKIGSELHYMTGLRMATDLHHNNPHIMDPEVKNKLSLHPIESSLAPLDTESCVTNSPSPTLTVLDIHLSCKPEGQSHDLYRNSLSAGGQGPSDQQSAQFSESASPMSSDRLSTVSSLETEMSRSRSSSLESEDKRSRSYKMMTELKGQSNTREEDVTSSTDDHIVRNSDVRSDPPREDNSNRYNLHPSHDFAYKAASHYQPEQVLSLDKFSPHTKPKQKRRRRQNVNKVIPPEQNYLPLIPNLGIDPQQMYLLQLHQMQMAMAASMAAGAQMYPFPGNRMMPTGTFDAYSPEISRQQHLNRDRSRSPQVARSHDLHRVGQEGLRYPPSLSPRNKDVSRSGSPTSANLAPSDNVTSSREEMMRYMMFKQEMDSNVHS